MQSGEFPVELEAALANRLLAELYQGKSPGFVRRAWYMGDNAASVDKEAIKVAMSSVNFHEAYSLYRQCVKSHLALQEYLHFEAIEISL